VSVEGLVEAFRILAREKGYALGFHGSGKRDLDLIAAPWTVEAVSAQDLVDHLCEFSGLTIRDGDARARDLGVSFLSPEPKPWGRLTWSLAPEVPPLSSWGGPEYVDLSVMPRAGEAVPVVPQRVGAPKS
jgi:hypothetical protein